MPKVIGMHHCHTETMRAAIAAPTWRAPHITNKEHRGTPRAASHLTPQNPDALHKVVPQLRTDCSRDNTTNCLQTPVLPKS